MLQEADDFGKFQCKYKNVLIKATQDYSLFVLVKNCWECLGNARQQVNEKNIAVEPKISGRKD